MIYEMRQNLTKYGFKVRDLGEFIMIIGLWLFYSTRLDIKKLDLWIWKDTRLEIDVSYRHMSILHRNTSMQLLKYYYSQTK